MTKEKGLITPPQDGAEQGEADAATQRFIMDRWPQFKDFDFIVTDDRTFATMYLHNIKQLMHDFAQSQTHALLLELAELKNANINLRELHRYETGNVDRLTGECTHLRAEIERLRGAIEWALGYTDFPARKEGDPPYYWRKKLRELSGIEQMPNIPHRSSPTQ